MRSFAAITLFVAAAGVCCAADNTPPYGSWSATGPTWQGRLRLTIQRSSAFSRYQSTSDYDISMLPGLSVSDVQASRRSKVHFSILRDAGSLQFDGEFYGGAGSGLFSFTANKSFIGDLERMGISGATDERLLDMALEDIGLGYVKEMHGAIEHLSLDDVFNLRHHGVTADYVTDAKSAGYRGWSANDYTRTRDHGVNAQFLVDLKRAGYNLGADEITKLRDHGVSSEYLAGAKKAGYDLSPDELIKMRDHGVQTDFLADAKRLGYRFSPDEFTRLRDHGVNGAYLEGLSRRSLSADEIIRLRDHGMRPQYYTSAKAAFNASPEDAIRLQNYGVSAEVARSYTQSGRPCSIDDIIRLYTHGASPDFVRDVTAAGFGKLSVDDLIKLRNNGVNGAYLRKVQAAGLKNLSVDQVVRLRQSGVD